MSAGTPSSRSLTQQDGVRVRPPGIPRSPAPSGLGQGSTVGFDGIGSQFSLGAPGNHLRSASQVAINNGRNCPCSYCRTTTDPITYKVADTQAIMSDRFAMVRGGLDKFPLIACFWCPCVVIVNGVSYQHLWRLAYATSAENVVAGRAPPISFDVLGAWIWIALILTHIITIPQFLKCAVAQELDRSKIRRRTFLVSIAHSFVISLPIAICEGMLLYVEDDQGFRIKENPNVSSVWLVGLSFSLSCLTPIVMVWIMYLHWLVDKLRARSTVKANAWVRKRYQGQIWSRMQRSGTQRPPPIAMADPEARIEAQRQEEAIDARINDATPPPAAAGGGEDESTATRTG